MPQLQFLARRCLFVEETFPLVNHLSHLRFFLHLLPCLLFIQQCLRPWMELSFVELFYVWMVLLVHLAWIFLLIRNYALHFEVHLVHYVLLLLLLPGGWPLLLWILWDLLLLLPVDLLL